MKKLILLCVVTILSAFACKKEEKSGDPKSAGDMPKPAPKVLAMKAPTGALPAMKVKPVKKPVVVTPPTTRLTCIEKAALMIKNSHKGAKTHSINVAKSIRWNEGFFLGGNPGIAHKFALLATFTEKRGKKVKFDRLFLGECVNGDQYKLVKMHKKAKGLGAYMSELTLDPKHPCGKTARDLVKKAYSEGGMHVVHLSGPYVWSAKVETSNKKIVPMTFAATFVRYGWDKEFKKNKPGQELFIGQCDKKGLVDTSKDALRTLNDLVRHK